MKLFGALFILVATTWFGFDLAKQLNARPKQLRQLKSALRSLEAEIMYSHRPLPQIARLLTEQVPKPIASFFDSFATYLEKGQKSAREAWLLSIEENWRLTALKQGEKEALKQFGQTLGQHDRHTQQKHIVLTLNHLEREEADAVDRQTRYEKMVKSLGFLTGLLLVILLL